MGHNNGLPEITAVFPRSWPPLAWAGSGSECPVMRLKCVCLYSPPQIWAKGILASHHSDPPSQNLLCVQCCPPAVLSLPHKLSWGLSAGLFLLWQGTAVIRRWISGSWSTCRRQHMRDLQRQMRVHDLLSRKNRNPWGNKAVCHQQFSRKEETSLSWLPL